jgi:hypothetical protein
MSIDTKDLFLVSAVLTQPTPKIIYEGWGKLSLVSSNLSQPTPMSSVRGEESSLWCRLTKASRHHSKDTYYSSIWIFQIQIHIGFKFIHDWNSYIIQFQINQIHIIIFTYIHSNNSQIYFTIFEFIICTHFHIVDNSKVHQMFTKQIFHNDKVEGTPLTSRCCWRMCHLHERSHGARTCKCPI